MSQKVLDKQARIDRHDAVALVFPVWWWTQPAVMKGWLDRVWNSEWAYGSRDLSAKKAVGVALFGVSEQIVKCGGYDEAMRVNLVDGTFRYCGIRDGKLLSYFDTVSNKREVTESVLLEIEAAGAAIWPSSADPQAA